MALACGVAESDFQLGLSKIFLRAGKGVFLEELKERDMSEVVPMLLAKIKEWEVPHVIHVTLTLPVLE